MQTIARFLHLLRGVILKIFLKFYSDCRLAVCLIFFHSSSGCRLDCSHSFAFVVNVSFICRSKSFNGLLPTASFLHLQIYKKIKRSKERFVVVQCNPQPIVIRLYKMLIDIWLWEVANVAELSTLFWKDTADRVRVSKWVKVKMCQNEKWKCGQEPIIYILNIYILYRGFRDIRKRKWHILTLTHYDTARVSACSS